jgi:hypothetical protein
MPAKVETETVLLLRSVESDVELLNSDLSAQLNLKETGATKCQMIKIGRDVP